MTKIAFVADLHVACHRRMGGAVTASINIRCSIILHTIRRAIERAHELGCSAFFVLGDLFDSDHPEPQIVAAVQGLFRWAQKRGMRVVVLLGNHDQTSTEFEDHALSPLSDVATIVDETECVKIFTADTANTNPTRVLCVPFAPVESESYLREQLKGKRSEILCVHMGVRDEKTAPWLRNCKDAISAPVLAELAHSIGAKHVVTGNWHSRQQWAIDGVEILQLGTLCPTGWSDPGFEGVGTLGIWEDGSLTYEVVPGPRFVAYSGGLPSNLAESEVLLGGDKIFLSWTVDAEGFAESQSEIVRLKQAGSIVDGEVLIDRTASIAAARTAATGARSADTLEDSLTAYVRAMFLDPNIDRDEVANRARRYLQKGG